jgi:hypothetical protein
MRENWPLNFVFEAYDDNDEMLKKVLERQQRNLFGTNFSIFNYILTCSNLNYRVTN